MLIEFISPSPKAGQQEHKSREAAAILIDAGFAKAVPTDEKPHHSHVIPARHAPGWFIETIGIANDSYVLAHYDGLGNSMKYEKPPGPARKWHYDPATGEEGYISEPSTCPKELVDEFLLLTGGVDPLTRKLNEEAAGERYREQLARKQYEIDQANRKVLGVSHEGKIL
jgi:hypothetical protein